MSNVSLGKKRFERGLGLLLGATLLLSPLSASASTLLPARVLPPGTGKACSAVTVSDIQAHVYNQNLDSFDITLSDAGYVAVSTKVGEQAVPFNYVSRWNNPDGSVRMHVDIQSLRLDRDIPIVITFLSAHTEEGGQVTCLFNVPAKLKAPGVTGSHTGGQPGSTGNSGSQGTGTTGSTDGSPVGSTTSTSTSANNPALVSAMSSLGNLCADGGSSKLWVVLLILFGIFTFTLCAQNFESGPSVRQWNIGLILAVFAGLLIFWYISAVCRTGPWAPAAATLIAIAGLLYTMLKRTAGDQILLLKDGKK